MHLGSPIARALAMRDDSLAKISPPLKLGNLPDPLPSNVCEIRHLVLEPEEIEITSLDADEILAAIRSKKYSCVTVTKAFLRAAALAQVLTNCITELLPEMALERAALLDALPEPLGPLHGLPISVKEHHGMFGRMKTCGMVAYIDAETSGVSGVNDVLWATGAVFYARTTMPQTGMHLETSSNIYGTTLNPRNLSLTPGGSSGGEAALIAFRGSVLGVGGDSGGSIRAPAGCTGIYGFKPSTGRLSRGGARAVPGGDGIVGAHGPMCTSRSALSLFMSTYCNAEPWQQDTSLVPLPWREVKLPRKLKIGVMWNDGIVMPHPPVRRALEEVTRALRAHGDQFELVQWIPLNHSRAYEISMGLYFEDGGNAIKKVLEDGGEEPRPLTQWIFDNELVKDKTKEEVWALKAERNEYRQQYNDHWLATAAPDGHAVDAILSPVSPGAAPPHGASKYWLYTSQWNLLEYPAVCFPVTTVDPAKDVKDCGYVPKNPRDKYQHDHYDPKTYVDAPIGLQIITRKFEDEKCLAILEAIEMAMGRE
ncbi:putative amidase [Colletotrichum spaethianum]|uniref:amidase n=1 Tax=Colletotrichum spaethianum TaxID=700344 RepID=A0AA37ULK7_9PEZI|nr:putative amidase [Colletotrichum spaethianum]GKT51991.1 putative amidase [Colletotrichum spaethianum]